MGGGDDHQEDSEHGPVVGKVGSFVYSPLVQRTLVFLGSLACWFVFIFFVLPGSNADTHVN